MWPGEAVAAAAAFCGGAVVATALAAFIIELGIIPRFAGITHTANHILLYETCLMLGSFLGNLVSVYEFSLPFGKIFLGIMALCFGIFWEAGLLRWAKWSMSLPLCPAAWV